MRSLDSGSLAAMSGETAASAMSAAAYLIDTFIVVSLF
jgi:hypothetical protein